MTLSPLEQYIADIPIAYRITAAIVIGVLGLVTAFTMDKERP